jgi:hypothetical protein
MAEWVKARPRTSLSKTPPSAEDRESVVPMSAPAGPATLSIRSMTAPTPYLHFPGTARDALTFYGDVFGCAVQLHAPDPA